jgi:hypothetical protein
MQSAGKRIHPTPSRVQKSSGVARVLRLGWRLVR